MAVGQVYSPVSLQGAIKIAIQAFATGAAPLNPITAVALFVHFALVNIAQGAAWRQQVNLYEDWKTGFVKQKYRYRVFPVDFVMLRNSAFEYDNDEPGSVGDYAHIFIQVKDVFPFTLNRNFPIDIKSIDPKNPSDYETTQKAVLNGYVMGPDGKYHMIDETHAFYDSGVPNDPYDHPGQPGIISIYDLDKLGLKPYGNSGGFHQVPESGKAYILAPGVQPNWLTDIQIEILKYWKRSGMSPFETGALIIFLTIIILRLIR